MGMSAAATLTPRQAAFIPAFLASNNATASAVAAGFSVNGASVAGARMLRNAKVQKALQARQTADATRLSLKRENVLAGLLDAVSYARHQRNPAAMISGLREIAKMQGYYSAETKRIEVSTKGLGTMRRLETMTDAELVGLIASGGGSAAAG